MPRQRGGCRRTRVGSRAGDRTSDSTGGKVDGHGQSRFHGHTQVPRPGDAGDQVALSRRIFFGGLQRECERARLDSLTKVGKGSAEARRVSATK